MKGISGAPDELQGKRPNGETRVTHYLNLAHVEDKTGRC